MAKHYFDAVDPRVNFPAEERKLLDDWYKKGIVKKYLSKNNNSKKYFSFLDGPITANNPMGVHHAWGRTYKDLWPRFKSMQGFKQRHQNGFDCQGLWVEVEVEKELGLKSKKDIENLIPGDKKASIAKFVNLCKERVLKFSQIQTEQSKRLGYFADWENSYFTMSDDNNYMIWHFLKKCHEKGLIYKGRDSVPWCPRCGTAISQHEILTEDYKELTHETVFFKLPVHNRDYSLLVWTTTPWTIPANVAIAVNPKFKYRIWKTPGGEKILTVNEGEIKDPESYDWFMKYVIEAGFEHEKGVADILGSDLVGLKLKYDGPFDDFQKVKEAQNEKPKTFHSIVPAEELVVASKGTGILHIAPGAGEEDFKLGKENDLPVIDVIGEEANYYEGMGEFSGQNAKKHPEIIIDYLKKKENGKFLFKISPITHRYPACWRCRTELVWRVVDEWYIAMNPLRQPLKKVAKKINWIPKFGLKREIDWLNNMHDWLISKKRYWGLALPIWECKSCGHFEVIGSKDELKEKAIEGWDKFNGKSPHKPWIDEVRISCSNCGKTMERIPDVGNPWLDAGIVPFSTISKDNKSEPLYWSDRKEWGKWFPVDFITESFPGQFKNWFYSLLAMSTVLEDKEPFRTVLGFGTLLGEDGRAMHKSWENAVEFNEGADKIGVDVMRWMYVRQDPADNLLFGYNVADETRRKFHLKLWNVYNYFVAYANINGWRPTQSKSKNALDKWVLSRLNNTIKEVTESLENFDAYSASASLEKFVEDFSLWYIRRSRGRTDKNDFYATTFESLVTLSRLLAPFTPFISEAIYRNLIKKGSVHLSDWPKIEVKFVDEALEREMETVRAVVERSHALRKEAQIPVRQALASVATTQKAPSIKGLDDLIKEELNVLNIKWSAKKDELDTALTPKLRAMGEAREVVRRIQEERKKIGCALDAWVNATLPDWPKEFEEEIKAKARVKILKKGEFKVQ